LWYSIKTIKIFFLGQRNLVVFDWDFWWLLKCLLVFKIVHISMDSSMKRILRVFLVKHTHTNNLTQTRKIFSVLQRFFFAVAFLFTKTCYPLWHILTIELFSYPIVSSDPSKYYYAIVFIYIYIFRLTEKFLLPHLKSLTLFRLKSLICNFD
jgi:hypothetical protein